MADKNVEATPRKNVQVSASVPPEVADGLREIFFDGRGAYDKPSDVTREAIVSFVESHGKM